MNDITKIKVNGDPESSYQLYPRNEEFAKRSGGGDGGSGVQPDWNQNDETQPDYVKNRPFYTGDPVETVLLEKTTPEFANTDVENLYGVSIPIDFSVERGQTYKVFWDGTVYECVCINFSESLYLGNMHIITAAGIGIGFPDTGEPFLMSFQNQGDSIALFVYTQDTSATHTISISGFVAPITKIDEKYLSKYTELLPPIFWTKYGKEKLIRICDEFATGKIFSANKSDGSNATSLILYAFYSDTVGFQFVFLNDMNTMKKIMGGPDNWTTKTFAITWS